jgi:hypothetical protein
VVIRAALVLVAIAVAGCGSDGVTCGRGRCGSGTTCMSIFGDGRKNQGWNDNRYPEVLNEWWCVRACPGGKSCVGYCLQDPANSDTVVCATDHVDVTYYSAGKACLCDPATGKCYQDSPVSGFEIIDQCQPMHTVQQTCVPNMDCSAGTFHAGDQVPGVREFFAGNGYEHIFCPGFPNNAFGPLLPEGQRVRIYADTDQCP